MFHRAVALEFKEGTVVQVSFLDGKVKQFDMAVMFDKYPQLGALKDRKLFLSGRLLGAYGIVWNDDLDIETETIYEEGVTVRTNKRTACVTVGAAVAEARARKGFSQVQLSKETGIDQSDLSKIERGEYNPSIGSLERIADALGTKLVVTFEEN